MATGRADLFSDIDLYVVADTPRHQPVLDTVERAVETATPIRHAWPVDPPPFPGVSQRIYLLDGAPRFFMMDCAVLTADGARQFLERERHGEPRILLDRDGTLGALPLDRARHDARMRQRLAQIRASWPVYRTVVEKELARGRSLDAIGFYFNGLLRPLVELLGMRYRPEKFDYGWRYLHYDLPADVQRQLESFAFVADAGRIGENLPAIDRLAATLFAALSAEPGAPR